VWLFPKTRVLIRGAGDLGSGVAYRLVKAGFPVMMIERALPLFVRRTVSFGNVIFADGEFSVEDLKAVLVTTVPAARQVIAQGHIPVMADEIAHNLPGFAPTVVIDARMQKRNIDTKITDAPLVIGMGPGFVAGADCHAVIETSRGHTLGRVIWQGSALPDTGTPGTVSGYSAERVLRAPADGCVTPKNGVAIGAILQQGDLIATMQDHEIRAPFPGVLRGLIHPSVPVQKSVKIGDLDPRGDVANCYTISDKALALGGGVLEAILSAPAVRATLQPSDGAVIDAPL
jgi:xanthine dehydrogenase accessory factor